MKLFCECNDKWDYPNPGHGYNIQVQVNLLKDRSLGRFGICSNCKYVKWYDANYENMMFDLKNMNQM